MTVEHVNCHVLKGSRLRAMGSSSGRYTSRAPAAHRRRPMTVGGWDGGHLVPTQRQRRDERERFT